MSLFPTTNPFVRQQVRNFTEGNMRASIEILRGSLGTLDPVTGLVGGLSGSERVYRGKARIRTVNGTGTASIGGGEINTRSTTISIPITVNAQIHADDLVRVLQDDESDVTLDTRIFRVMDVDGGGFFGDARRMSCVGWYESRYWGTQ